MLDQDMKRKMKKLIDTFKTYSEGKSATTGAETEKVQSTGGSTRTAGTATTTPPQGTGKPSST